MQPAPRLLRRSFDPALSLRIDRQLALLDKQHYRRAVARRLLADLAHQIPAAALVWKGGAR